MKNKKINTIITLTLTLIITFSASISVKRVSSNSHSTRHHAYYIDPFPKGDTIPD